MTPRDRRALMLGVTGILGGLFVFRVVPWTLRMAAGLRARAEQQALTAARARAVLAAAPTVHDSLARVLSDIVALAPTLVDGHSSAEAQASLSALLSLAANRHELKVMRLDPLADSSAAVFTRITVHAELEGDVTGLSAVLKALETGELLLSVGALAVTAPDPHPNSSAPEVLRLDLDVSGYYLPRGSP